MTRDLARVALILLACVLAVVVLAADWDCDVVEIEPASEGSL